MNLENLFDKFTSSVMGWKILVEGVKIRLELLERASRRKSNRMRYYSH